MTALNQPTTRPAVSLRAGSTPFYLGGFIALGLSSMLLGPSLETFRHAAGVSTGRIGVLFTAASTGYLAGSIGAGRALRRVIAHRVIAAGLLVVAGALACLPTARSLWLLVALQAVVGFGGALIDVTANSVVLWTNRGGPAMNALHLCFGVGATLAPVVVNRSVAWTDGIRAGYLAVVVLHVAAAIALLRRASPPNPHAAELRGIPAGCEKHLVLAVLFFACYVGVELGFAGWVFEFAAGNGFERDREANWLGAAFLGSFTLGRLVSVPVATRVSARTVLLGDVATCSAALAILIAGGASPVTMWVGTIAFGLGMASMFPTMLTFAEPLIPSTSTVTSAYLVGGAIGGMTIPVGIGAVLDRVGSTGLPVVVLAGTVLCGAVVIAFSVPGRLTSSGERG